MITSWHGDLLKGSLVLRWSVQRGSSLACVFPLSSAVTVIQHSDRISFKVRVRADSQFKGSDYHERKSGGFLKQLVTSYLQSGIRDG